MRQKLQAWWVVAREHWSRLGSRERMALQLLGVTLTVLVAYFALVMPLTRSLADLRASVPGERAQLARMRDQAALIEQLRRGGPAPNQTQDVVVLADQLAQQHGFRETFNTLEPDGNQGLRIQAEGASFNGLLGWLGDMQKQGALRVEQAGIEAHSTAGSVNARLTLKAAAAP